MKRWRLLALAAAAAALPAAGQSPPASPTPAPRELEAGILGLASSGTALFRTAELLPGWTAAGTAGRSFVLMANGPVSLSHRRFAVLVDEQPLAEAPLGGGEAPRAPAGALLEEAARLEAETGAGPGLAGSGGAQGAITLLTRTDAGSPRSAVVAGFGTQASAELGARLAWQGSTAGRFSVSLFGEQSRGFSRSRVSDVETSRPCSGPLLVESDCLPLEEASLGGATPRVGSAEARWARQLGPSASLDLAGSWLAERNTLALSQLGRLLRERSDLVGLRGRYASRHWTVLVSHQERREPELRLQSLGTRLDLEQRTSRAEARWLRPLPRGRGQLQLGAAGTSEALDLATGPRQRSGLGGPRDQRDAAYFGSLELNLLPRLGLAAAARQDLLDGTADALSYRASLSGSLGSATRWSLGYSRGFLRPSLLERSLLLAVDPSVDLARLEPICRRAGVDCGFGDGATQVVAVGNARLEAEGSRRLELGVISRLGRRWRLVANLYSGKESRRLSELLPALGTSLGRINPDYGPYRPPAELPAGAAGELLTRLARELPPPLFALLTQGADGRPLFVAYSQTNLGGLDTLGADLELSAELGAHWRGALGYSYFDFRFPAGTGPVGRAALPNVAQHRARGFVEWRGERIEALLSGRWVDGFRWVSGPFRGNVPGFAAWDLAARYRLEAGWRVGLEAENLLDHRHFEVFGGDVLGRRLLARVELGW